MPEDDKTLFANGFEAAFMGWAQRPSKPYVAIYNWDKCIEILQETHHLTYDDAVEYFEFNTLGAWMGEGTPMFMKCSTLDELEEILDNE